MYPIIRRKRYPMIPPAMPTGAQKPCPSVNPWLNSSSASFDSRAVKIHTDFVQFSPATPIPQPSTSNHQPPKNQPLTKQTPSSSSPPPTSEVHADSVQFRSVLSQKRSDSFNSLPPELNGAQPDQGLPPGPLSPPHLWSRQPDEPATDYQLFAAWLEFQNIPVRAPCPRSPDSSSCPPSLAAVPLGCRSTRLTNHRRRRNWMPSGIEPFAKSMASRPPASVPSPRFPNR